MNNYIQQEVSIRDPDLLMQFQKNQLDKLFSFLIRVKRNICLTKQICLKSIETYSYAYNYNIVSVGKNEKLRTVIWNSSFHKFRCFFVFVYINKGL